MYILYTRTHKFHKSVYTVHTLLALGPAELVFRRWWREMFTFLFTHTQVWYMPERMYRCMYTCLPPSLHGCSVSAQLCQAKEPEKDGQAWALWSWWNCSVSFVICLADDFHPTIDNYFSSLCFLSAIPKRWYPPVMVVGLKTPTSIDLSILDRHTWPSYKRTYPTKSHYTPCQALNSYEIPWTSD